MDNILVIHFQNYLNKQRMNRKKDKSNKLIKILCYRFEFIYTFDLIRQNLDKVFNEFIFKNLILLFF